MKVITLLALLFFVSPTHADDTLKQITKNAPELTKYEAKRVAKLINKVSKKFKIPTKIFTAILMQESRYKQTAKSKCKMKTHKPEIPERLLRFYSCLATNHLMPLNQSVPMCNKESTALVMEVCQDVGIAQINIGSIHRWKLNYYMVSTDIEHNIEVGAMILADFYKRYSKYESKWWSRYNSSKPSARTAYERRVSRWL